MTPGLIGGCRSKSDAALEKKEGEGEGEEGEDR